MTKKNIAPLAGLSLVLLVIFHIFHPLVQAANFSLLGQATAENTGGFLDFEGNNANIHVNLTHQEFSGYAWSEDVGWIDFSNQDNPLNQDEDQNNNVSPVVYNADTGLLSGKAYVLSTDEYLYFSDYGSAVTLSQSDGSFVGYAFSMDLGWVNFTDSDVQVNTTFPVDTTEPSANATNISMQSAATGGHAIADGGWSNSHTPVFSWDGATDDSEIKGYCLYLGTDETADPGNHISQSGTAGLLINSPVNTDGTDCQFIVSGLSLNLADGEYLSSSFDDGETYYLRIKAIDTANNTYNQGESDGSAATSFSFGFDSTDPTNVGYINSASGTFNNIADMNFSWPTSGGAASSDNIPSGVLGWQYAINSTDTWKGSDTHATLGIGYIPVGYEQPYHLSPDNDTEVEIGDNILYFRTVDQAGNYSIPSTYRTGNLAYGGDAPLFPDGSSVTITPLTSESNNFALSWPAANPAPGNTLDRYYYMINETPPVTLSTLISNPAKYIATTNTAVATGMLPGVNKGGNVVRVVAVDTDGNYSPSNVISGAFTLDSSHPDPAKNLTVSDASIKSASLWRASLAWDHPDYKGTGTLTYAIQRSSDGVNWQTVMTTNGTAYVDTVSESRQYYWRIGTSDTTTTSIAAPSYTNAVMLTPKGSYQDPADLTSGPSVEHLTTRKAEITWTTNRDSDSKVAFGTKSGEYYDEEPSNSDQVTDHSIKLTNLSPGTTYYFKARWTDEDGNTGESEEKSFSTTPAPTVTDPQATQIGLDSAIVRYTVKGASKVKIYYGRSTEFGAIKEVATSTEESTITTELIDLADGSLYYYKINPVDSENYEYEGQALTFETMPRPRITNVKLQEVKGTAQTTILVSWTVNTPLSSIITYAPVNEPGLSKDQVDVRLLAGTREMTVSGLLPQRQYQLVVKGRDKAGNEAVSDTYTFTTATDTRPPQVMNLKVIGGTIPPVGFAAGEIKAQLIITWDTDEPATSQVEYAEGAGTNYSQKSQEDGNLTTNHTIIISGLTPSKVYHFRAVSRDAAGNEVRSVDMTTIAPKATKSALDLVLESLSTAFGFLGLLKE